MLSNIKENLKIALTELLDVAKPEAGEILVVGCSTSEVLGKKIGTSGSDECATLLYETIAGLAKEHDILVAAQCCEHLNRCLVVEKETAKQYHLVVVSAVPHTHAGGAFATAAYAKMKEPVLVEQIQAHLGVDIGNTLIGMHLIPVVVPVRVSVKTIGEAPIVLARTRPKYVGGERAHYN